MRMIIIIAFTDMESMLSVEGEIIFLQKYYYFF